MPESAGKAVFLSYASQDAEAARKICDALCAAGVEVWFDQSELRGGDAWDAKIRKQIKECALFVPIISANTQARTEGYFRLEWKLAVDRSHLMADDAAFLFPVVIDDITDATARVPDKFCDVQWMRVLTADAPAAYVARVRALLSDESPPEDRLKSVEPIAKGHRPDERGRWRFLLLAGVAALIIGLGASVVWFMQRNAKLRWVRQQTLPEINRLIKADDISAAFALTLEAEKVLPDDPALTGLWPRVSQVISIETTPAGAEIYIKPYQKPDTAWRYLGKSPLKGVRVAREFSRWRIAKAGFAELDGACALSSKMEFALEPANAVPAGMVHVEGGPRPGGRITLESFFIDRYEVTNRQFKEFVDRGGYTTLAFWKQPFAKIGKTLSWTEAIAEFRDPTGQPGPATWKHGTYAAGEADHPVTGVSWFEAAAFAESVGKRLPSYHHWWAAASGAFLAPNMTALSNFSGHGSAHVGSYQGVSRWGAYDMAGNAKEWCWNEAESGKRYLLGGGSGEPAYQFTDPDAQLPFDRSSANGFRCMQLKTGTELADTVDAPFPIPRRNYASEERISEEVFTSYLNFFTYDKTALEERTESTDESSEHWRKEKMSVAAAYGNERLVVYLFLPKKVPPPYQAVIYCPGSNAFTSRSSDRLAREDTFDFIVESRRAVVYPVYKGTFERGDGRTLTSYFESKNDYRDLVIQTSKDLGRTLDYLETRKDIHSDKLAFLGFSWGGVMGSVLPALEGRRLKANVLVSGGSSFRAVLPQVDQINFAPRITIPTLMLNGRYDFTFIEPAQQQLYRLLGAPPETKKYVVFEKGHTLPASLISKDVVDWLDKYLGPVK
jgi:formylglycine-generating enzyme required for sulfatase activity/dienelactone hydrolase